MPPENYRSKKYKVLGAEPNGHIILPDTTYPDAIKSALQCIKYISLYKDIPCGRQLKTVFSYEDSEILNRDFHELKASSEKVICNDSIIYKEGINSRCFIRRSNWENSIIFIFEGNYFENELLVLFKNLNGLENRRVVYVEN